MDRTPRRVGLALLVLIGFIGIAARLAWREGAGDRDDAAETGLANKHVAEVEHALDEGTFDVRYDGAPRTPLRAIEQVPPAKTEPVANDAPIAAMPRSGRPIPFAFDPIADQRARVARLQSPDPKERLEAVRRLPPAGTGVEQLRALIAHDPEIEVRRAAAHQLGGGNDYAATRGLIEALSDPASDVVVQALEALGDLGDPSVVPDVQRLLHDSPDPAIQAGMLAAIARLREGERIDPDLPEIQIGEDRRSTRSQPAPAEQAEQESVTAETATASSRDVGPSVREVGSHPMPND